MCMRASVFVVCLGPAGGKHEECLTVQGERCLQSPSSNLPPQAMAQQLLSQDLPLFLQRGPEAGSASDAAARDRAQQGRWFQLRRLHFSLPECLPCSLGSRPVVQLQVGAQSVKRQT